MITEIRFIGEAGSFIPGIPPKDMTIEEWATVAPHLQEYALASGLYIAVHSAPKPTLVTVEESHADTN